MAPGRVYFALLVAVVVIHLSADYTLFSKLHRHLSSRQPPFSSYSWIEDDVPPLLPLHDSARSSVVMPIEDSVRYGIRPPEAYLEWVSTATPNDRGTVRLGPKHRVFVPSIVHELHCLRSLRTALDDEHPPRGPKVPHTEHCLSFLRQHILCDADSTLEYGDVFARNFTTERVTGYHQCVDVEGYYATMWGLWQDWVEVLKNGDV